MFIRYLCGCVEWHGEFDGARTRKVKVFQCSKSPSEHDGSYLPMTENETAEFLRGVAAMIGSAHAARYWTDKFENWMRRD